MNTRNRVFLAAALIMLPVLLRVIFFYQAPYFNNDVQKPSYTDFSVQPPPTPSFQNSIVANPANGKVIVIDNFHGNQFSASEIEPLVTAINASGATVEYDNGSTPLEMELKYASAYVVFAPATPFSNFELRLIQQFVTNGGRLLVFSDPTRGLYSTDPYAPPAIIQSDVNNINPLIATYGLTVVDDYLYNLGDNEGNFRNVKFTDFPVNPLTKDLHMVVFYGSHSIHSEEGSSLASGNDKTLSSLTDRGSGLSPIALSLNGQVLVSGDFSFIANPYNQVADNQLLLAHIAEFAVSGERTPALTDFPYLFQRPVSLKTASDIALTSDLLEPLAGLQKTLKAANIQVTMQETYTAGTDKILLGTFNSSEDLALYLKSFNIDLENQEFGLKVGDLGTVNNYGVGILLFDHGPKTNTLTLLAATSMDLPQLIKIAAGGDLSACLIQDNIAICNLADPFSGGFNDFNGGGFEMPTPLPPLPVELTPIPTPFSETPTPVG